MDALKLILAAIITSAILAGCGPDRDAAVQDRVVVDTTLTEAASRTDTIPPADEVAALATETGEATFYADSFDRQRTASGELLDQSDLVAAHRRFPFGTIVRVTNLRTDRSVDVRIIDRGPFGAPKVAGQKVIDLSRRAANEIGIIRAGRAVVRVDVLSYGNGVAES